MLREAIGMRCKVFACNYSGHKDLDFPITKFIFSQDNSYKEFEKKFFNLFKMSKKYFKMLGKHKDFIMADPNQFDDKIKKRVFALSKAYN